MGAVIELNKLKDQIDTNTFDNHNMTVRTPEGENIVGHA